MSALRHPQAIAVFDFGGQTAHLIASQFRRCGAYAEVVSANTSADALKEAAGVVLSGGPQSVYSENSIKVDPAIFDLDLPVLGICYGAQLMVHMHGGQVKPATKREFGRADLLVSSKPQAHVLHHHNNPRFVWMSHGDEIIELPACFLPIASTENCTFAAFARSDRNHIGLQFHPEVSHTQDGHEIFRRFAALCHAPPWSLSNQLAEITKEVTGHVGNRHVFMLVSGGVDSTVAFALLDRILGPARVHGCIIDNGLMRKGEIETTKTAMHQIGFDNLEVVQAADIFFQKLQSIHDPEDKRIAIGDAFVEVQQQTAQELNKSEWLLGQGTIYPDTIETGGTSHADKIKTHHNRCQAIQDLISAGLVVEPLKDLYKDEVRQLGELLGLPHDLVWRHPFPGPGLAVRILCTTENAATIGTQCPNVPVTHAILPVQSVGVQGDGRSYCWPIALFSSQCQKGIIPDSFWELATHIPNTEQHINRVVACLSVSRPAGFVTTADWVTPQRAALAQEAEAIVESAIRNAGLYEQIWQFPVVLLPIGRFAGGQSIVLRPVASRDAMTADCFLLPSDVLQKVTRELLQVKGIDDVYLDLTSKPPGTIEWE